LRNIRSRYSGRVVGVEVETSFGRRVYEVKMLDTRGRLFEVYCDVATGEILRVSRN
jgi:uncharacterized membrane protein YkoI